jgi:hypothetical protein
MRVLLTLVLFAVLMVAMLSQAEKENVTLEGHVFTADLPDGWKASQSTGEPYNSQDQALEALDTSTGATDWTGTQDYEAFNYYGSNQPSDIGFVDVFVLKPKQEYLDEYQMNSSDPIVLEHATALFLSLNKAIAAATIVDSVKDINFNGKPAHLVEFRGLDRYGVIAFSLDDENIALIRVTLGENLGSSPWDIINSITIS